MVIITIIIHLIFIFIGSVISIILINKVTEYCNPYKSKDRIIDDKNFIIDGKFISLEEDTPLLRFKQKQEDDSWYRHYESTKLMEDREYLDNMYIYYIQGLNEYSIAIKHDSSIKEEDLEKFNKRYEEYKLMCEKLKPIRELTKEEYAIRWNNLIFLDKTPLKISNPFKKWGYELHNEKTAKYLNGDMKELLREEFKQKQGY